MARDAEIEDLERGERIRELRVKRGVSQEDAAHDLKVSGKTYWNWENGREIKPVNLKRLATYYKVERDYIARGDTPEPLEALSESEARELRKQLDRIEEKLDKVLNPKAPARRRPPPQEKTPRKT